MNITYRIPDCNLELLQSKIAKLAKKAIKLGLTPPALNITGHDDVPVGLKERGIDQIEFNGKSTFTTLQPGDKILFHRRYHLVMLTGEAPVIPGYELVAVIDHTTDSEIGNLIRTVPGQECPIEFRHAQPLCDHCHQVRRRNETFVLKAPSGAFRQIGRNCLADFCRSPEAAENLVNAASILESALGFLSLAEEEDGFGMGGRSGRFFQIETVLSLTSAIVRGIGWTSRAKSDHYHPATADLVTRILAIRGQADEDRLKSNDPTLYADWKAENDSDTETAIKALEWVRDMRSQSETLNDYLYNLLVVCSMEAIETKHLGLACSLIAAYGRETAKLAEAKTNSTLSNHIGTIKKREVFTLTFVSAMHIEGNYGVKHLYRFKDSTGNVVIWWATVEKDLVSGETYQVKGTVKAHSEYKGLKQTELSRCVIG